MSLVPQDIREAMEIAEENAMDRLLALADIYAPEGETWDVEKITSDRDFVAFYIDLSRRPFPPPFSILDYLPQVAPEVFQQLTTRYERALAKIGA
jgi:hypothetical protein